MATPVSLGLMSLPASWDEAQRHAAWAEGLGFDSLWTGDHLRHPRDPEGAFLDGWSLLPAWAAVTSRVRLGMLVSNLTYRHPAVLARQAAAVDHVSSGRLDLGVGTGVYAADAAMAGVPEWTAGERVERLGESLAVLDQLLRGDVVDSAGPHFPMAGAVVRPRPVQRPRPPLVVGALGRRTIGLAVRHADAWNTWAGFVTDRESAVAAVRRQCGLVTEECERQGRDPDTLRRSLCAYGALDPWATPDGLVQLAATFAPLGIGELVVYPPPPGGEADFEATVASFARG